MAQRKGNGKLRHVKVGLLWIQQKIEEEELFIEKVLGRDNPADLMTKNLALRKIEQYMDFMGQEFKEGRAEKSLNL